SASGIDFSTSGIDFSTSGIDFSTSRTDLSTGGSGIVAGGPCTSGATRATAIRVRWVNSGGTATVQYEKLGLPAKSDYNVSAANMSFNYTPSFGDQNLNVGGLEMPGGVFVAFEISTVGITAIDAATFSIYGRSYNTSASGSFSWQSFTGTGATPT